MTQKVIKFKNYSNAPTPVSEYAEAVGLSCDDEVVTLRFMVNQAMWGAPARQVRLDRKMAEELSRLLNYELDSVSR